MKQKTLEDYVLRATNYLYPLSEEQLRYDRNKFMKFCKKHGLTDEFIRLVEENEKWAQLAQTTHVQYFVDIVTKAPFDSENILPQIELRIFNMGTIPVIKVSCEIF